MREHAKFRVALTPLLQHADPDATWRLAAALWPFWQVRGLLQRKAAGTHSGAEPGHQQGPRWLRHCRGWAWEPEDYSVSAN